MMPNPTAAPASGAKFAAYRENNNRGLDLSYGASYLN